MGLEEPHVIDAVLKPKDGKMGLLIFDAGVTTEPEERFEKLVAKFKGYVDFIMGGEFKRRYPGVEASGVTFIVVCRNEPTQKMKAIAKLVPGGNMSNQIKVVYDTETLNPNAQKREQVK